MKRLFCAVFISFIFFSCNTSAHFPVPGESEVKKNNMYVEYLNIANTYMELEKFDKAIEFYSKAVKYRPLYWTCMYKLGRAQALSKNYKEARKIYNKLLKRDRNNVDLQISLAYLYAMEGKISSSIAIYEYLCSNNPGNADILVNFINVLISDNQIDYAGLKFEDLKNTFPDNENIESFQKKFDEFEDNKESADQSKKN